MNQTRTALAASLLLLSGCVAGPTAWLRSAQDLEPSPRVHSWAFQPAPPDPERDAIAPAVRAGLARAGWPEAPADQAELLAQIIVRRGGPHMEEARASGVDAIFFVSDLMDASQGRPVPSREPRYETAYSKELELRLVEPGGRVAYIGQGVASSASPWGEAVGVALARALLERFPGKRSGQVWTEGLPREVDFPQPPVLARADGPASPTAAAGVAGACARAVPVQVDPQTLFRKIPDRSGAIAFRSDTVASGCATTPTRGHVRVVLADGRSGYVPGDAVRYHPGP